MCRRKPVKSCPRADTVSFFTYTTRKGFHALTAMLRPALVPALSIALVACAHTPKTPPIPPYDLWMAKAEASVRAQDVAGAKANFRKASEADPKAKEPWRRLAELDFNAQDYGPAIVEAQEVLKRDPMDTTAQSVLTVSGLRVALDALGMIHRETDPNGPAHLEAAKVARKLRETLGQDVLVPPKKKRKLKSVPSASPNSTMPLPGQEGGSAQPGDPFSALRVG